ncbi:MAG: UDP-N-acetylmuramoyl-L-alanyl-D-glutamate--2,6-diaminopimelate ligase [Chloroflexi bacterium]|nr:UDP-N-acetylmuramoyl-L-alanyl-D-glutamate--2,6-diaminopimelate ligase [Chloroflexota bacterium]
MTISPLKKRSLKKLLAAWTATVTNTNQLHPPLYTGPDITLHKFTEKTGEVEPGSCFVARVRPTGDGHPHIGKALAAGASMILAQRPPEEVDVTVPDDVLYLQVDDTAETLAWLAAAWHNFPSREMVMVGITGTNGKTSTASLLYSIFKAAEYKTGMISTLKAMIGDVEETLELHVSTPEAPVIQRYLRQMADAGITHCILETTSHGLAQHRVTAVDFDTAVITNITHEHLDYHGNYETYFQAKARLFEMVAASQPDPRKPQPVIKTAILNLDDSSYERLAYIPIPRQFSYSLDNKQADMHTLKQVTDPWGTYFEIEVASQTIPKPFDDLMLPVKSKLLGVFSIYNMLTAAATAYALGVDHDIIQDGLQAVELIHGRMQQIQRGQKFIVHVDFAHTPDSLDKAISAARGILHLTAGSGRVITVFGSAGLRDPEKRRLMAEISAANADLTLLTAEDPRTESLDNILETMAAGCRSQGGIEDQTFWRIPDRGRAIYQALTLAGPQDFVLICGKGHEQSMCFSRTEYPWDDVQATTAALDAFLAGEPMPDLGLPTFTS